MIDQEKFERLAPLAFQWAKTQEDLILKHGAPLAPGQIADALRCGVHDSSRVRVLVVDRILLPDDKELAEAARRGQIITEASRGVTIRLRSNLRRGTYVATAGGRDLFAGIVTAPQRKFSVR